jgi:type II secretory pathway component PulK
MNEAGARRAGNAWSQTGSATLMVLLLLSLIIGIGFAFRQTMGLEGRAVALYGQGRQAAEGARAGLEVALSLLRSDEASFDGLADSWAVSPLLAGSLGAGVTYSVRGSEELGDNGIFDLESRLPINGLPEEALARLPGLSAKALPEVAAVRRGGPFASLQRFLEVSRLDLKAFERTAQAPPRRVLTAFSRSAKLNVNTAGAFELGVALGNQDLTRGILTRRRGPDGQDGTTDDRPWRSLEELHAELGLQAGSLPPLLDVRSAYFSVTATGEVSSGTLFTRRRLRALVERTAAGPRIVACTEP